MLKTYRIIPLVFILFLFGFTFITVAPVSAFFGVEVETQIHKRERNKRIQENAGKVQKEDRNVCNGLSMTWAEMRFEGKRGRKDASYGNAIPWVSRSGFDNGSRNWDMIFRVFGREGVGQGRVTEGTGGLNQKIFDACMQNRAKGCATTDRWYNGRLVFNGLTCGGGGFTIDESMYIDKHTGKMHKR